MVPHISNLYLDVLLVSEQMFYYMHQKMLTIAQEKSYITISTINKQ